VRHAGMLIVLCCAAAVARADDWPRWRGPGGDGISREQDLAEKWPDAGPRVLWTAKVGAGYSSPVAVDGVVYLFSTVNDHDTLTVFDAGTGKQVWSNSYDGGWTGANGSGRPGTRSTPAVDGDVIFTYGGESDLVCWSRNDGRIIWRLNVIKKTGGKVLNWGTAGGPTVSGDYVYVQGGIGEGAAVAVCVEKASGKIHWTSEARGAAGDNDDFAPGGGYAYPVVADVQNTGQLLVFASRAFIGMDVDTGKTLWSEPWVTVYDVNSATPIYEDGHAFVSSAYDHGCMVVELTPGGGKKVLESQEVMCHFQPPILDRHVLYANSAGTLKCVSWPDVREKWQTRELKLGSGGSMVRVPGDRLILMTDTGKLWLIKANAEGFEKLSRAEVFAGQSEIWATPLVYNGRLYCKGTDELRCLDISKQVGK